MPLQRLYLPKVYNALGDTTKTAYVANYIRTRGDIHMSYRNLKIGDIVARSYGLSQEKYWLSPALIILDIADDNEATMIYLKDVNDEDYTGSVKYEHTVHYTKINKIDSMSKDKALRIYHNMRNNYVDIEIHYPDGPSSRIVGGLYTHRFKGQVYAFENGSEHMKWIERYLPETSMKFRIWMGLWLTDRRRR